MLSKTSTLIRPKLIVAGASAYSRHYDYARMRKVRFQGQTTQRRARARAREQRVR